MSVLNKKSIIKTMEDFDFFHKLFLKLIENKYTNVNYDTNSSLKRYLKTNDSGFELYNIDNYIKIYEFINDVMYITYKEFFKSYGELKHIVFFSIREHSHEFSPKIPYLGLSYRIVDKDNNMIFKMKLSPYVSLETNEFELNWGIKILDPQYMMFFKAFKKIIPLIKGYPCTCFTDFSIFVYAIATKIYPCGLDRNRVNFQKDLESLNELAFNLNKLVPVNLQFDENGIIKSRNKNVKLMSLRDILPFPNITSYIHHHNLL